MKIEFDTNSVKNKKKIFTIVLVIFALLLYTYAGYLIVKENKGCEYCTNPTETYSQSNENGSEYKFWPIHNQFESSTKLSYASNGGWGITLEDQFGYVFSPEIKYCPLCGSRLKAVK